MHNKLLMSLLLAVSCGHAGAEWVKVSRNESSVFYMDTSISKKMGANVMIWVVRDHAGLQYGDSGPYLSSKDQIEVDCNWRRIRRIYSSDHPQHMGAGRFVHSEHGPMSWNNASRGTVIQRIVDIACANG